MTWGGVPILDWVLLAFLIALGIEAWVTTRSVWRKPDPPPKTEDPPGPGG